MSFVVGVRSLLLRSLSREKTILLVFEECYDKDEMVFFFEKKFKVLTAGSGESALRKIRKGTKVDLVVTDRLMPQMSGSILAKKIKEISSLPVIISSSAYHDGTQATIWAQEEGADDGYSKDCQLTVLLEKIDRLLSDR